MEVAGSARAPGARPTGRYNAAADLLGRHRERAAKPAYLLGDAALSYGELDERARRFASALLASGVLPEQRVALVLDDGFAFPVAFLGSILASAVPVPLNTMLTAKDLTELLVDMRASAAVVGAELMATAGPALTAAGVRRFVVDGACSAGVPFDAFIAGGSPSVEPAPTRADEPCFWLYSSGSTGIPKGVIHSHGDLLPTAELYAGPVLGVREDDVLFSAAKLFFAYGLGNALTFPLAVGATTVLHRGKPTPEAVGALLTRHRVSIFFGVPTLYGHLLADASLPDGDALALRHCVSAGEALPADLARRWGERTGTEILDGLGSTELTHIFLSNRSGDVRHGTSGIPVPGYELRIVDDEGHDVAEGELGELLVSGPTSALGYWNRRARSQATFEGRWTRTGDKYRRDERGSFVFCGRNDDMLKVGGIYVSPFEIESCLVAHEAVLECAVVGRADEEGLIKPKAFVVCVGDAPDDLQTELVAHAKANLASWKYPRWVEVLDALPKTATGKVRRFALRQRDPGATRDS
ncbi:MAG: benzoate-CoA ligase family protein [Myxococcota bacterium]